MSIHLTTASPGLGSSTVAAQDPSPPQGKPGPLPGSTGAMASRKVPGDDTVRPRGLLKLADMPDMFGPQIADRLPLADVARLAAVDKTLHWALSGDAKHQARADVNKIRQMTSEALKDQPGALAAAFAARDLLPPQQRGELVEILAQNLDRTANAEELIQWLDPLHEVSQGLASPARADILALMSARIDRLPPPVQTAAFDMFAQQTNDTLDKADMLAPLQALAGQIHVFPANLRLTVMGVLAFQNRNSPDPLLSAKTLDPPELARLLPTLSEAIHSFEEGQRLEVINFLRGLAMPLPPELRVPVLQAFSRQIHLLPEEQRADCVWINRCEIQNASSDPLLAGRVALKVAGELTMPYEERAWLLGSLVHTSGQLPEGPRAILLGEVRQVVAGAQWPGAEDVRQRLDAAGH